ncbi:serine hydrolase domain-containing protein [Actinomadura madurae]|uniref:serine hydrolase domain-containing protein n=1 Tax=Actinomadura madurae TaxID=1993 RepID=UPI0020D1F952|nr:serine hydrolase domain-containing protein [Actinomadura madurae]MCP9954229.1 beta-lactamase family protein [Actinomadura madurae]MCP9970987.1 beta-lactamase family protein [Actinomadura madurae]MCP9983465.1 beta-lactamase family protein [Actinomadura madurae]MCQ0004971.1 beta-lactamase family protein [Actinomadura madurae]MCQ0019706.1 beta-lactamase family protein [Actinomadura madurae]
MVEHTSSTGGARPSRRTALKALGGVAAGGAVMAGSTVAAPSAAAHGHRTARIPGDLKPGGALDRLAADLAAKDHWSGSLLVTHRGRTVLSRSHGFADRRAGVRNRPGTRFAVASLTKMFTGVAIHQLAQQGKVDYGEKLGAYLEGIPAEAAEKVTLHHLLTHTSGLGHYYNIPGYPDESRTWSSAEEVFDGTLEYIRRGGSDLAFEPGTRNSYSNTGYFLLGAIVAAVSDHSYYDYITKRVFAAADMHDSAFHTKPEWRADPRIAHPYYKKEGQTEWTDGLEEHPYIGLPSGNSFATCADLERFARVLLENKLMEAPYTQLMLGAKLPPSGPETRSGGDAPERSPLGFIGYGSLAILDHGQWIHGHGGGSSIGLSANIDIFPDSDWVVVVLSGYADRASNPLATLAREVIVQR